MAAYVACGGNPDKTGHVDRDVIRRIIKVDFGLDIDIDKMMDAVDHDGSGEMEFDEFQQLLSGKPSAWVQWIYTLPVLNTMILVPPHKFCSDITHVFAPILFPCVFRHENVFTYLY